MKSVLPYIAVDFRLPEWEDFLKRVSRSCIPSMSGKGIHTRAYWVNLQEMHLLDDVGILNSET
jgi:hypothetical protein